MERLQGETVLRRHQGAEHTQETVRVMLEHQAERGDYSEVSQNKKAQMLDGAGWGEQPISLSPPSWLSTQVASQASVSAAGLPDSHTHTHSRAGVYQTVLIKLWQDGKLSLPTNVPVPSPGKYRMRARASGLARQGCPPPGDCF